jgi:hypothetical protein
MAKAGWAARSGHTSVVDAAGAIYVIGGSGDGTTGTLQDVWASTDGGVRPDYVKGVGVGGVLRGGTQGVLTGQGVTGWVLKGALKWY